MGGSLPMKRLTCLLGGLLLSVGICFATDPVEGFWVSVDDKTGQATAGWELYQNEGKLYGKILSIVGYPQHAKALTCKESYRGFPLSGKVNELPVVGTPWIFGLSLDTIGYWSGGNVINPQDGNMYKCKIIYHPKDRGKYTIDTLEVRGEIGLGIGRSQFWQRSSPQQAASLR
jgi:uncharacterized protein (DUF2147 family)